MQDDRNAVPRIEVLEGNANATDLVDVPAVPSFSFADANFIVDIEVHANQLLAYIDKLTTLADRACNTALRQTETAQSIERSRQVEIERLRDELDYQKNQRQEQQLALIRVEQESKARIAVLESQLNLAEVRREQAEKDKELIVLRREKQTLISQLAAAKSPEKGALKTTSDRAPVAGKSQAPERPARAHDQTADALRAKILELEQRLTEAQAELRLQEAQLKEKEALVQMAAAKEAEMGNLIKRLSSECATLSNELHEHTRKLAKIQPKKQPSLADGKIWRRVIARLQEEPQ
jgi:chromosome segregation ATPase